jgi:hypothetical protein
MTLSLTGNEKGNEDKSEYDNELNKNRTVIHATVGAQAIS